MVVLGGGRWVMGKVPLYRFLMSEVPCTVFLIRGSKKHKILQGGLAVIAIFEKMQL